MRNPKVVINADDFAHLEGLANSMTRREPELAERLLIEIRRARVVATAKVRESVVIMGSTVTYRDETTGQQKTVVLIYPEEEDVARLRVSVVTPIGIALLGLSVGARFHWDRHDEQDRMLTVLEVIQL